MLEKSADMMRLENITLIPSPVMRGEGRGRSEAPEADGERSRGRARLSWAPEAHDASGVFGPLALEASRCEFVLSNPSVFLNFHYIPKEQI